MRQTSHTLLSPIVLVAAVLGSGCGMFGMTPQDNGTKPASPSGSATDATGNATASAEQAGVEPDLEALIGSDVDTRNFEAFRGLKRGMTRAEADAIVPGAAAAKGTFSDLPTKLPGVAKVKLYFSEEKLSSAGFVFPKKLGTQEFFQKVVAQCKKKWGDTKDSDRYVTWGQMSVKLDDAGVTVEALLDPHLGKSGAFDGPALLGKGAAGTPPEVFARYPKTLTKDAAKKLDNVATGGTDAFVTFIPEGAMFSEIVLYYGDGQALDSVKIKLNKSISTRENFLALKALMDKRYGAGKPMPEGSNDKTMDRALWRTPRMRLAIENEGMELELRY